MPEAHATAAAASAKVDPAAAFVETTNEAAVRAFVERVAQLNGSLNPVDLVQTSIDENGRTLYRLSVAGLDDPKPGPTSRSRSPKPPFALPFAWPIRHPLARSADRPRPPADRPRPPAERKSLRPTRSIPLLRVEAAASRQPASEVDSVAPEATAQRELRRIGSSPLLTSSEVASAPDGTHVHGASPVKRFPRARGDGSGDVIGHLLHWRTAKTAAPLLYADEVGPGLVRHDRAQPVGLQSGILTSRDSRVETSPPVSHSGVAVTAVHRRETPTTRPRSRPSHAQRPFGSDIRLPHIPSAAAWQGSHRTAIDPLEAEAPTLHLMREVSSSDSVRTAKAGAQTSSPIAGGLATTATTGRSRKPAVFDAFCPGTANGAAFLTEPAMQPLGLPIGHHGRVESTRSLASFLSDTTEVSAHQITVVPTSDDDPRCVVWGEKVPERPATAGEATMPSQARRRASPASSATNSPVSADRFPNSDSKSSPASSVRHSVDSASEAHPAPRARVLLAATVERLVAELTSQIAPDLLADVFLTFRAYLAPLDLMHLLLARFDWAMTRPLDPVSSAKVVPSASSGTVGVEDEALRRIVRVRTFVVLRYWLLNHFMQDFYPSRELRTTLTNWLNASAREERFRSSPKDLRLIKALKKTVRKCKDAYISGKAPPASRNPVLDTAEDDADEEVDLDLSVLPDLLGRASVLASDQDVSAGLAPSSPATAVDRGLRPPGLIARRLSDAMGTIGRVKKKLAAVSTKQARSSLNSTPPSERSLHDRIADSRPDLLRNEDRLQSYLRALGLELETSGAATEPVPDLSPSSAAEEQSTATDSDATTPRLEATSSGAVPEKRHDGQFGPVKSAAATELDTHIRGEETRSKDLSALHRQVSYVPSYLETPMFSLAPGLFGPLVASARPASVRVELDDLSDSSDDDDDDVIEAKRVLKRLPPARNFGLGIGLGYDTHASLDRDISPGTLEDDARTYSALFVDDEEGYEEGELVTVIPNFTLDGLVNSDEEDDAGGVEAALRRLEGIVDDAKERRHAERVRQQMEKSSKLEEERRQRAEGAVALPLGDSATTLAADAASPAESVDLRLLPALQAHAVTVPTATAPLPAAAEQAASLQVNVKTAAASGEQKQSSRRANLTNRLFGLRVASALAIPRTLSPSPPSPHRAYVMYHQTDVIVQHFTLIERDLLRMLSYQELVDGTWRQRIEGIDVLDWEAHVKERRRLALDAAERGEKTSSAVQDLLARFNLTTNWVASEILLTASLDERVLVVSKFIRLAFKSYCLHNLQTMMQFVYGLLHPDVERLHQTWSRVPAWELRKLDSMKTLCGYSGNFRVLRTYMRAAAAGRVREHAHKVSPALEHNDGSRACLPFLGLLLQDMVRDAELPTLLDPSAPDTAASIHASGRLLAPVRPTAFDGLPPLPSTTPLAPLVNVHKFRRLAETVRTVQTFQEMSRQYTFEPISAIYLRCLKLRALDAALLHELSLRLEP